MSCAVGVRNDLFFFEGIDLTLSRERESESLSTEGTYNSTLEFSKPLNFTESSPLRTRSMTTKERKSGAEGHGTAVPIGLRNHNKSVIQLQSTALDEGDEISDGPCTQTLSTDLSKRLDKARILGEDDKLLLAARYLRGIDSRHLQKFHHDILREAAIFQQLLNTTTDPSGWVKQGQHIGRHNFSIHYKIRETPHGQDLSCQLETVLRSELLVPIISVLNESELYTTWLPNWTVPKLQVTKSEKIQQSGRCSQVINVETEVPWPLASRQVILKAVACDNIDRFPAEENDTTTTCVDEDGGRIIIRIQSLDSEDNIGEGLNIPACEKHVVRLKVQGCFIIEKCPADHAMTQCLIKYDDRIARAESSREDLVLVTFRFCVDPQLTNVPKSFINFFVRTVIGQMWNKFLNVAEEVKDGLRPAHSEAIAMKRELVYEWVEERTKVLLLNNTTLIPR